MIASARQSCAKFTKFGGNTKELAQCPSATTKADQAYDALHEMARQAERNREFGRAGEIREALGAIDKRAVEALQALTTKHGIPEAPFIQAVQQPPAAVRTDNGSHGHPTAGPHSRSNRLDRRLQAIARPDPAILERWPGSRPCKRPFECH